MLVTVTVTGSVAGAGRVVGSGEGVTVGSDVGLAEGVAAGSDEGLGLGSTVGCWENPGVDTVENPANRTTVTQKVMLDRFISGSSIG